VTECQGCGAWNDASRTLCVLCGTPLAATDEWDTAAEPPPLPPLPDGGLSASMPSWMREPPAREVESEVRVETVEQAARLALPPLGPHADPRTFLSDDDFPRWLRDLAARRDAARAPSAAVGDLVGGPGRPSAADWPVWPSLATHQAASDLGSDATAVIVAAGGGTGSSEPMASPGATDAATRDGRPPAAIVAARALEERRERGAWESLLLVILFIVVVVAAIWALVANGVFSPGL
jgi:hypothetical protein